MNDEKEVTIQSLLTESQRQRQIGTEKYYELSIEMKGISEKMALLGETITHLQEKREQLNILFGEKHKQFEDELNAINTDIAKNKAFIESSSVKEAASGIDQESAMFFMDNLNKSAEESLRLTSNDKQTLHEVMMKLEPLTANRTVPIGPRVDVDVIIGCSDCIASCKGACRGCSGSCMGSCQRECMGSCKGACFGGCLGTCFGGCEAGCLGPIKAGT